MYRPGTDESNVQMSDVLCDYCHRAWTTDEPFLEGHRGTMICGRCLSVAYVELHMGGDNLAVGDYFCRMSQEGGEDRSALNRGDEPGWRSPVDPEAAVSRMCVRMAAAQLERDGDHDWSRPAVPDDAAEQLARAVAAIKASAEG